MLIDRAPVSDTAIEMAANKDAFRRDVTPHIRRIIELDEHLAPSLAQLNQRQAKEYLSGIIELTVIDIYGRSNDQMIRMQPDERGNLAKYDPVKEGLLLKYSMLRMKNPQDQLRLTSLATYVVRRAFHS